MLKNYLSKLFAVAVLCCAALTYSNAQSIIGITEPAEIAGGYYAIDAIYGPDLATPITGTVMIVDDGVDVGSDGCDALVNDLTGMIALVDRGACGFAQKSINAQNAGAIAVIICNNDPSAPTSLFLPGGDDGGVLTIPTVGTTFGFCETFRSALPGLEVTLVPSPNYLCAEAQPIEAGTYTVDSVYQDGVFANTIGFGATSEDADAAAWYSFTPTEDGLLTVNSCLGGADTRVFLHTGTCTIVDKASLNTLAGNDDACPFEEGNDEQAWASAIARYVTAGTTYYIEWDNRWLDPNQGFTFSLDFEAIPFIPEPGQACDAAIEITPGTYSVDTITGFGANGPNALGGAWYSFTPESNQLASISACNSTDTVDTRVYVYTGSCDALTLSNDPGNDDDVCDVLSEVAPFPVMAGVTYYIEWSDIFSAGGFDFELTFQDIPDVNVTLTVDMTVEGASDDGVFAAYAPLGATSLDEATIVQLTDNGDNTFSTTFATPAFDSIGYVFGNGTPDVVAFSNVEMVPEECSFMSNFGFRARLLVPTTLDDLNVEPVCYASCLTCIPQDCAAPLVLITDDFEGYMEGEVGPQSDIWSTWSGATGGAEEGIVSTEVANSGDYSLKMTGGGSQDVYLPLTEYTEGHFYASWDMYIPAGQGAYFNMQHFTAPGNEWAYEIAFGTDGTADINAGEAAAVTFDYRQDTWFNVIQIIDIDNNVARLIVDQVQRYAWPFNWQANEMDGTQQIGGFNFYPRDANDIFYIDNFLLQQIPAAEPGQYAHTATAATEGVNTVAGLSCFGGGFDLSESTPSAGIAASWSTYTPTEDGVLSISSCGGGVDTRGWILSADGADLTTLAIEGVNDDLCDLGDGNLWASYREALVTAGNTYYIMWDNIWDVAGFNWDLTLTPGAGEAGNFCGTAVAVTPGEYEIITIDGNAAIAGPNIDNTGASTTNYAQSEWYSYTPDVDGVLTISSCDGAGHNTRVWVYTGDCSFDGMNLVASDDNSCGNGVSAVTTEIETTAGTTYYIEWDTESADDNQPFTWELLAGASAVEVTFNVDANILIQNNELDEDGIFLAGTFNGFTGEPMTDNGDGTYSATVLLGIGETFAYKYQNGAGSFETVNTDLGEDCTVGNFGDRSVTVGEEATSLDMVCFGYCVSCDAVMTDVTDPAFEAAINVFPNPVKDVATIQYNLETAVDLKVEVINSLGQVLQSQIIKKATAGTAELNVTNLPAGIYTVQMTDGARIANETLVVEK